MFLIRVIFIYFYNKVSNEKRKIRSNLFLEIFIHNTDNNFDLGH